ncbi:MAG: PPOX class F420-dependent oxidoreductase [Actinomycetota bacterium]
MTLEELQRAKYVSLTTFKRDGSPVSTPVWVAGDDGRLLVWTGATTWKAKRIRRDPHVRIGPCTASGKPLGDAVDGEAAILEETDRVEQLLARKYGLVYRVVRGFNALVRAVRRRPPVASVTIEIRLEA